MTPGPGAMSHMAGGVGVIFFVLIWLLIMGTMIVAGIIFLIAVWRGMKAHESIADSLRRIADKQA